MPDVFTKAKRSWVMSRIRGRDTGPERFVESILRDAGVSFEMHPRLFGRPDFIVADAKVALFVDGDFWHGYRMGTKTLSNMSEFWKDKIARNKKRDRIVNRRLKREGWTVVRIWEHDIERDPDVTGRRILNAVKPSR